MLTIGARVARHRRRVDPQWQLPVDDLVPGDLIARLRGLRRRPSPSSSRRSAADGAVRALGEEVPPLGAGQVATGDPARVCRPGRRLDLPDDRVTRVERGHDALAIREERSQPATSTPGSGAPTSLREAKSHSLSFPSVLVVKSCRRSDRTPR